MITYKDCPECGARKIHSTVRLCEVCETCEKYESKLAGEAAHIKSLEGLLVDAARERDEARAEVERLQRLLDHATQSNPGTSVLVMLMNEAREARAETERLRGKVERLRGAT